MTGSRTLDTHLYKLGSYPYDLIAPVTIMWSPLPTAAPEQNAPVHSQSAPANKKGKGKEPMSTAQGKQADPARIRSVWVCFHPSVHLEVLDVLKLVASQALATHKAQHGDIEELKLELADLRGHFNVFEIMGPKSSQIIKGALSPVASDTRKDFLQVCHF